MFTPSKRVQGTQRRGGSRFFVSIPSSTSRLLPWTQLVVSRQQLSISNFQIFKFLRYKVAGCTSSPFAQARICSVWIASSRESAQDARPQSGLLWVFTCTDKKSPFFIQDKNIIELTRHSMKGTSSVGSVTACRVQAKTCKPLVLKPQTDIHRVWSKAHSHEFIFLPNH